MYKVKLWKIKSSHNNLRTDIIEGECNELPKRGKSFVLFSESLSKSFVPSDGLLRHIITTPVTKAIWDGEDQQACLFKTKNSTYVLLVKDEGETK